MLCHVGRKNLNSVSQSTWAHSFEVSAVCGKCKIFVCFVENYDLLTLVEMLQQK